MAIDVKFYTLSKRENSTLRPGSGGTSYSCNLKDGCGIITPVIELSVNGNPTGYNYCYIAAFGRYYFISDPGWEYFRGVWSARLTVDVMATYKTEIGNSSQYVTRAASDSDGTIIDTYYPTTGDIVDSMALGTGSWDSTFDSGSYVVGFVCKDNSGVGPVTYYVMDPASFRRFMGYMLGDYGRYMGEIAEISQDLLRAMFNPVEYIASCLWFPFNVPHQESAVSQIDIGSWTIYFEDGGVTAYRITNSALYVSPLTSITIPKHPQAATRGIYLNSGHFSRYFMEFKPFGEFEIDASYLINYQNLYYSVSVDCVSGMGMLQLSTDSSFSRIFKTLRQMVGIPIQMASLSINFLGGTVKTAQGALGAAAGVASGNYAAASVAALGTVGNAIDSVLPGINSTGSNGSLIEYHGGSPRLIGQFFKVTHENNADAGRPLCVTRVIYSLSGYIKCAHADIALPGTLQEIRQVKDYMEGGFFYE